jgi:predicted peptidase
MTKVTRCFIASFFLMPDTTAKIPLVIFLHGSGERGNDNEAQLKWGVMNFASDEDMIHYPAFVIAPQCPSNMSWSNFNRDRNSTQMSLLPSPTKPMQLLIELIDKLKKTLRIDTTRIYITGLSMGGFGTYDAIMRYPKLFAAGCAGLWRWRRFKGIINSSYTDLDISWSRRSFCESRSFA